MTLFYLLQQTQQKQCMWSVHSHQGVSAEKPGQSVRWQPFKKKNINIPEKTPYTNSFIAYLPARLLEKTLYIILCNLQISRGQNP
jgi:hypothetical protein